ncbi:hypothetical protein P7K49_010026 [Saguinus oedipus]|uniref:TAFH domain-containing protein n=1 Tax=Saguinus oedipus TaxID=9490 RepID=A0ABQ9VMG4_SAGOE|nr:hypothetical protein P7K49_010026 [Saguinus oedipus]
MVRPVVQVAKCSLEASGQLLSQNTGCLIHEGSLQSGAHLSAWGLAALLHEETMENVKKCKNFLSTLIKLASSGKQSTETAANVKELVQNLLVRDLDFTFRLP